MRSLVLRALADKERGLGNLAVNLTPEALDFIIAKSDGDARRALNALEIGVLSTPPGADGVDPLRPPHGGGIHPEKGPGLR